MVVACAYGRAPSAVSTSREDLFVCEPGRSAEFFDEIAGIRLAWTAHPRMAIAKY